MEEENLITCHEKAFIFFTGTTKTILYDNMKAVVIGAIAKVSTKFN
jgi:transposase